MDLRTIIVKISYRIRHCILTGLILSFIACLDVKEDQISIQWENEKGIALLIPKKIIPATNKDSIKNNLQVYLAGRDVPVLGEITVKENDILFTPLVSLTAGLRYEVRYEKKLIGEVQLPSPTSEVQPLVLAIYPGKDTVPENLLKIYLEFSSPMQEGIALDYINLIKDGDTISSAFLDLQPELWNEKRNLLTLWLDPGRIKRDLQPNQQMGPPLVEGGHYQIVVDTGWRDQKGINLSKQYLKNIIVANRDTNSPQPEKWTMNHPSHGSKEILTIDLQESLDYAVLKNSIRILNENSSPLKGEFSLQSNESILNFIPETKWIKGKYFVEIEAKLEDLAGNNLNRLFDKDLSKDKSDKNKPIYKLPFVIN